MRQTERSTQIVQVLRYRRLTTAQHLARELGVSERTVYRDIRALLSRGVPVEGEAGVGYRLGKGFELPPLALNLDEVEALSLGMRMVQKWGDNDLSRSAKSIIQKLELVLPESESRKLESTALFALSFQVTDRVRRTLRTCRKAVNDRRKLAVCYTDPKGNVTQRTLCPLGLFFWGQSWTLAAYCELRGGFRNFRLDRFDTVRTGRAHFEHSPPLTLDDYLKSVQSRC
jgi:predicted DNA-binding transcriptional regulator YafY